MLWSHKISSGRKPVFSLGCQNTSLKSAFNKNCCTSLVDLFLAARKQRLYISRISGVFVRIERVREWQSIASEFWDYQYLSDGTFLKQSLSFPVIMLPLFHNQRLNSKDSMVAKSRKFVWSTQMFLVWKGLEFYLVTSRL